MNEQTIPIDINTNKLLDWLVSRRHIQKDWQNSILKVREKISNAIQDMPAHEGIIKLLSGQHINYFHCLRIVDILKETEKESKNIFGTYGSQRMKDWQDILYSYQKDNIYLAEAAQILVRTVSYEIPSFKKQIAKSEQSQLDAEKKIKDYTKTEAATLKEFCASCEQLGIKGKDIKKELLELLKELPSILEETTEKIKIVKPAIDLYTEFNMFLSRQPNIPEVLPTLNYLIQHGNTTTYEYMYGEKPIQIDEPTPLIDETQLSESENIGEAIDFGDLATEVELGQEIDFGESNGLSSSNEENIDWGSSNESFEVVNYDDVGINLEESGIVVEKSGLDGGIARGEEALTILDNPKTREQIINNLFEIQAFLKMRIFELANESDTFILSQMQDASSTLQTQTVESVTSLIDCVNVALIHLTSKRLQHLHNLKHSPKYVDILTGTLKQKLTVVDKMKANKVLLEEKIKEIGAEIRATEPVIKLVVDKTKELQKQIEEDISKKYKGRVVNIVGAVNML